MNKGVLLSCVITVLVIGILIFALVYYSKHPHSFILGEKTGKNTTSSFNPQTTQLFMIGQNNEAPITILGHILPQFAVSLAEKDFSNLWVAHAQERETMVQTEVVNAKRDGSLQVSTHFDEANKQVVVTPVVENSVKPGMYTLTMKVKTLQGKDITITQNFAWGVLAVNTNKSIYKPGDTVGIGMTVLDDFGRTKCISTNGVIVFGTAKVFLTVTSPSGKMQNLSTVDGSIVGSKSCKDRSVSYSADFLASISPSEVGKYTLHMEAETLFGKRSIDSFFTVSNTPPAFDIERVKYPTRIYPRSDYPVTIAVTANKNYSGTVYDIVPASLTISEISGNGKIVQDGDFEKIQWQVNWQQGQIYYLTYTIHFPRVAPEFYLVGPLTIGNFTEGNEWQIASDSVFSFIQEANNWAASGTSITATMSQGVASNDLVVMNCYKVTNSGTTTTWPNISGWSRSYRSGATGARYAQYYRVVSGAFIGTTNITCTTGASSTGEFAVEVMEFSGNATAAPRDKSVTRTTLVPCTTTSDITSAMTPTNPDELVVTQFLSTTPSLTATSHTTLGGSSQGFTDNDWLGGFNGFSGADSSYDSAWAESVNNPPVSTRDTVIFSGGGTTCLNAATAYNASIILSQGSYRFFDNQDSLTVGSPLAAANTTVSLTTIGQAFRVRMLLDIDSSTGTSLGLQSGDFILQVTPLPLSGLCSSAVDTDWTPVATVSAQVQSPIAWNQNDSLVAGGSGVNITAAPGGTDPSDTGTGYTTVLESYYQDDFSSPGPGGVGGGAPGDITNDQNALSNNQAGLWDFSLVDNTGGAGQGAYCLRLANSDGSALNTYRNYPQVSFAKAGVVIRGGTIIKGSGGAGCIAGGQGCGTQIK